MNGLHANAFAKRALIRLDIDLPYYIFKCNLVKHLHVFILVAKGVEWRIISRGNVVPINVQQEIYLRALLFKTLPNIKFRRSNAIEF